LRFATSKPTPVPTGSPREYGSGVAPDSLALTADDWLELSFSEQRRRGMDGEARFEICPWNPCTKAPPKAHSQMQVPTKCKGTNLPLPSGTACELPCKAPYSGLGTAVCRDGKWTSEGTCYKRCTKMPNLPEGAIPNPSCEEQVKSKKAMHGFRCEFSCGEYTTDAVCIDGTFEDGVCSPFHIVRGDCMYDGDCVTSPGYPNPYPLGVTCEISVRTSTTVGAGRIPGAFEALTTNGPPPLGAFATEGCCDIVSLSGRGLYWDSRFGRWYRSAVVEEKNYSGFLDIDPFETWKDLPDGEQSSTPPRHTSFSRALEGVYVERGSSIYFSSDEWTVRSSIKKFRI
jgi:hypothetical protein